MKNWLVRTGLAGSVVFAVCCFTPLLVWILAAAGLSAWVTGLDWVLLPLLAISFAILLIGLSRNRREAAQ